MFEFQRSCTLYALSPPLVGRYILGKNYYIFPGTHMYHQATHNGDVHVYICIYIMQMYHEE